MNRAYEAGKLSGESMQEYITLLRRKDKRQLERVLNDQMPPLGVEALSEPKNWQIIREEVTDYGSRLFRYLLETGRHSRKKSGKRKWKVKSFPFIATISASSNGCAKISVSPFQT